jgi:hypothetical protein
MKNAIFFSLLIIFIFIFSCNNDKFEYKDSGIVKYEVSVSGGGCVITFINSEGKSDHVCCYDSLWEYSFVGNRGDFAYVCAQADSLDVTLNLKLFYQEQLLAESVIKEDHALLAVQEILP